LEETNVTTETQELDLRGELLAELKGQTEGLSDLIHAKGIPGPTADEHHAAKLTAMREHLTDLDVELDALDTRRKEVKTQRATAISELNAARIGGPEFLPLLDGPAAKPEEPEAWRELSIDGLGLPSRISLALQTANIVHLGQLSDRMDRIEWWDEMKGVGMGMAEKIAEAFATFWASHPEYCEQRDEVAETFDFDEASGHDPKQSKPDEELPY